MSSIDLDHLTASQALADLHDGRYSALALAQACLARIDQRNSMLNAVIAQQRDAALARQTAMP